MIGSKSHTHTHTSHMLFLLSSSLLFCKTDPLESFASQLQQKFQKNPEHKPFWLEMNWEYNQSGKGKKQKQKTYMMHTSITFTFSYVIFSQLVTSLCFVPCWNTVRKSGSFRTDSKLWQKFQWESCTHKPLGFWHGMNREYNQSVSQSSKVKNKCRT